MDRQFYKLTEEIRDDLNSINPKSILNSDFNKSMLQIKQKLEKLKQIKVNVEIKNSCEELVNSVIEKFKQKLIEFKKYQDVLNLNTRKNSIRIIKSFSPDISGENLERVIKNPDEFSRLKILSHESDSIIVNKLKDVQEKYQDVLSLEVTVSELHQMFMDFAILVDTQGDMLDRIELGIKEADEYVTQGNDELQSAIKEARKLRMKQLYCCCLVTSCLIVIGIIIFVVIYIGHKM
jgi:syntaxin 1B/2/3